MNKWYTVAVLVAWNIYPMDQRVSSPEQLWRAIVRTQITLEESQKKRIQAKNCLYMNNCYHKPSDPLFINISTNNAEPTMASLIQEQYNTHYHLYHAIYDNALETVAYFLTPESLNAIIGGAPHPYYEQVTAIPVTPLTFAAILCHVDIIKYILNYGRIEQYYLDHALFLTLYERCNAFLKPSKPAHQSRTAQLLMNAGAQMPDIVH